MSGGALAAGHSWGSEEQRIADREERFALYHWVAGHVIQENLRAVLVEAVRTADGLARLDAVLSRLPYVRP